MSQAGTQEVLLTRWLSGASPLGVDSKKLGMWFFIVSDSITFSALLISYAYVRVSTPDWPRPFEMWPAIAKSSLMTLVLLSSSLTMVLAVVAAQRHELTKAVRWLLVTMSCGITFIVIHATEWLKLLHEGVTPRSNPWNPLVPLFGGSFFGITGLHMLHVSIGVIYLGVIAWGVNKHKWTVEHVEVSGLYWHFVDLVWMFIFPMVYLLSVKPD